MKHYCTLSTLLASILLMLGCAGPKTEQLSTEDWSAWAIETAQYIKSAQYDSEQGTTWRVMPDSTTSTGRPSLYHGSAGVVLFYLELYHATQDSTYLQEARLGADYLISMTPDSVMPYNAGLYVGLSGMGYTLTEVYKATQKEPYKQGVLRILSLLQEAATPTQTGVEWQGLTDIMYGSAGIGLFLQDVAEKLQIPQADSLAVLAANGLIDHAIDTLGGLRWKFSPDYTRYMDNFSHGTAGVGYFLSETYQKTRDPRYLEASLEAARLLDTVSNAKGYAYHHYPRGEELYYLSWCHGPPGTSRFYYSLYQSTSNAIWLDKVQLAANSLMLEGIDTTETPGFWNNAGKCCGTTGVAEYYLWLHRITGEERYLRFALTMTKSLLAKSKRDHELLKWVQAENRVSPDELAAQTGLMQGSAGIGLWFLRLHAQQQNQDYLIHLPDEPRVSNR